MKAQGIPMTFDLVMAKLENLGSMQIRRARLRCGVPEPLFGVSFANLVALKKKIKTNQPLAEALWASGNCDARILATMIADPLQMNQALLDFWADDVDNVILADALAKLAAKTPVAQQVMPQWIASDMEWISRAGWGILVQLSKGNPFLPDRFFEPYLANIEKDIHTVKNPIQTAMKNALTTIGTRNETLRSQVLVIAARIGKLDEYHGDPNYAHPDTGYWTRKQVEQLKRRHEKIKRQAL